MKYGTLHNAFSSIHLHEAIINKQGTNTPSTFNQNKNNAPNDGIWSNISLTIKANGFWGI
jgi:hypothetical protein